MTDLIELERRLWAAADALRANSSLTPAEYRGPVLGLIFLAFADHRFDELRPELELKATERRPVSADDFRARGVLFVPEIARLSWLVNLPEGEDLGANIDLAMDAIEATNTGLRGVLPRGYQKLEKSVLLELVRLFAPLPRMVSGDAFGLIYEYFLAEFAANEGRRGGEFFTPQSIVRLIVDVIEPFHGRVYDPACGSGGMFVHSASLPDDTAASRGSPVALLGERTG
ncbi:MAG: N-6 DNA methylase [Gaiellaceae bacterium]